MGVMPDAGAFSVEGIGLDWLSFVCAHSRALIPA